MKVLQVTEFFAPWVGGISEHVANLCRELAGLGHEVHVLTSGQPARGGAAPPGGGARIHRLAPAVRFPYNGGVASASFDLGLPRRLDALFAREGFDVVHLHNPMTPTLPLLALDRSTALNVGTFHAYHRREHMLELWRPLLRSRMRRLHLALAVSSAARAAYQRYFESSRFEIVPNGIDLARFAPNGHVEAPEGEQCLLFVGQLVPKKGLGTLLAAFGMLQREFPRLRLRVVGDGPLRRAYARSLAAPLAERVEFLGARQGEQLVQLYRDCDVFCAPSTGHESFGITLLEAMAAGKPIVAARIPGFVDVVHDGREAVLHRGGDAADLRDALRRVLTDGGLRRSLTAQGRRRVQRYSWRRVALEIESRYERLLGQSG
jgi:phosphatidylinositol alpha-mannosyltransferase